MFWVYVIKNKENAKTYTGWTSDLEKRLKRHNGLLKNKVSSFTSRNKGNWQCVYTEQFAARADAIKREKQLKSCKGREYIKSKLN